MDSLSRGDLQKLCLERRKAGLLPSGTKCNGSRDSLLELLSPPKIIDESKEEPSKYGNILRHLAPYLTLDKLLLILAYYPHHPLMEEVKDLDGAIWSDRTWAELGEAPLSIGNCGIRYYHLWSTRKLSPWGELIVPTKRKSGTLNYNTHLRVQDAAFSLAYSEKRTKATDLKPATLTIWALRPQGFYHLQVELQVNDPLDSSPEIMGAISKPSNWRLVSPDNFTILLNFNGRRVYALDSLGNLRLFTYNLNIWGNYEIEERSALDGIKLRYVRSWKSYLYGITTSGEHIIYDTFRGEIVPMMKSSGQNYPRPGYIDIHYMENLYYRPLDPGTTDVYVPTGATLSLVVHPRTYILEMVEDEVYLVPEAHLLSKIYGHAGTFPLRSLGYTDIIGVNGKVYEVKTIHSRGGDYKLKTKKIPYRYFYYASGGVAW